MNRSRGVTATADEVVVTSGAGHAIDLVARVLLDPEGMVAVESQVIAVSSSCSRSQGSVSSASRSTTRASWSTPSPLRPGSSTSPRHTVPLGVVMTRHRRLELLAGRAHRCCDIEDDYDSEFRYAGRPWNRSSALTATAG